MNLAPISPMSTESVDSVHEFSTDSIRSYESSTSSFHSSPPTPVRDTVDSRLLLKDQLAVLLSQEKSYQLAFVPCSRAEPEEVSSPQESWRLKICEWCYRVVDHFRMERDVVSISMNLFDRFLYLQGSDVNADNADNACKCPSCQRTVDRHTFQLAAVTSLYLAIKVLSSQKKKLRLSSMLELSRGQFSARDICEMERHILSTLAWKVNPVIPSNVNKCLLSLMPTQSDIVPQRCQTNYGLTLRVINDIASYLSELSVCLPSVSSVFLPSEIAYASILVAMQFLSLSALPESIRQEFRDTVSSLIETKRIVCLAGRLSASFCPGLLFDGTGDHPLTQAYYLGLLDPEQVYPTNRRRPSFGDRSTSSIMDVNDRIHHQPDDRVHAVSP
jgi:Cyclin, N-terminal domain